MNSLCVIGLGYIGLPTAAVFADNGWKVQGVDVNPKIVSNLNKGKVHIEEKGLGELVREKINTKTLQAQLEPSEAEVYIIAVPTPHKEDNTADLTYVEAAVRSILPVLREGNIVIIESTIPPRTTRDVVAPMIENANFKLGKEIYLAHCPERVLPGKILEELYENNRIVGGLDNISSEKAGNVYQTFVKGKVLKTEAESAEMAKLMENTYRDVNIALANELAKISSDLNINALDVVKLANEHPRVNVHQPGPGVGGHCLAVDPYFIIEKSPLHARLISEARSVNKSMPGFIVKQIENAINKNSKLAIFGLAYKGNVDDIRESPAIQIVSELQEKGYELGIYEPHINQEDIHFNLVSFEEAIENAEAILILTDHDEFKEMNMNKINNLMNNPIIIDTKNCLNNWDESVNYFNFGNLSELKHLKIKSH